MGEVVNLNRFRKQTARQQQKAQAEANRLTFGRTKTEKTLTAKERADQQRLLDGHKLSED